MSSTIPITDDAAARSQIWWLLSRLYLERPDAPFLGELAAAVGSGMPGDASADAELAVLADTLSEDPASLANTLQPEYTRLLRGIQQGYGPPPPYESLHRGESLLGDISADVLRSYRDAGFDSIFPAAGPQDHIGVELRFLALLCFRESEAWAAGDPTGARRYRDAQCDFLDRHLLAWLPDYARLIADQAGTPFYAAVAQLTGRFAKQARRALEDPEGEDAVSDEQNIARSALA